MDQIKNLFSVEGNNTAPNDIDDDDDVPPLVQGTFEQASMK